MATYVVQFKCETRNGDSLSGLPEESEDVQFLLEPDGALVVSCKTNQADAQTAVAVSREIADRVCRLIGLGYGAYEVVGMRIAGEQTATKLPSLPWHLPYASVADTGDGRILTVSATGAATRNVAWELSIGPAWHDVPERLQAAANLLWDAQLTTNRDVKFILLMAVLDVLISETRPKLVLATQLDRGQRKKLLIDVTSNLEGAGLNAASVERLLQGLNSVKEKTPPETRTEYLAGVVGRNPSLGEVTAEEVKSWVDARNAYIHDGARIPAAVQVERLNAIIGGALRSEIESDMPT